MSTVYNFYLTLGTVPSLYAEMNIFLDKTPSYVYTRSAGRFDATCIDKMDHVKYYHQFICSDVDFMKKEYHYISDKILEVKEKDSDAKFNVYVEDTRSHYYIKPFMVAGAYKDINHIFIVSEGNSSINMYYRLKDDNEEYCKMRWKYLVDNYDNDDEQVKLGPYAYYLSTRKNVTFLLPHYKLFKNIHVSPKYRKKMHLVDFPVEEMYNKLTDKQKKYIFDSSDIKIDKKKKYLIIIGPIDFGSKEMTTGIIQNLIEQMYDDYQNYILFYKSHPACPVETNQSLLDYLNDKDIHVLPSTIPIELFLWEHKNIDIGGFSSSIVSLIEPSRVKFVFGQNVDYAKLLFDVEHPLKQYNVIISQNLAHYMLTSMWSELERQDRVISELKEEIRIKSRVKRTVLSSMRKVRKIFKK